MRDAFEAYIQGVSHLRNSEVEQAITVNAYPIAAAGFGRKSGMIPTQQRLAL